MTIELLTIEVPHEMAGMRLDAALAERMSKKITRVGMPKNFAAKLELLLKQAVTIKQQNFMKP